MCSLLMTSGLVQILKTNCVAICNLYLYTQMMGEVMAYGGLSFLDTGCPISLYRMLAVFTEYEMINTRNPLTRHTINYC